LEGATIENRWLIAGRALGGKVEENKLKIIDSNVQNTSTNGLSDAQKTKQLIGGA
jgi:hypothetical protein